MIDALKDQTYIVRHNPNCPKPFQIIVGSFPMPITALPKAFYIAIDRPENEVGYGMTLDEAAAEIVGRRAQRAFAASFRNIWDGL